jgi:hypothetical protein
LWTTSCARRLILVFHADSSADIKADQFLPATQYSREAMSYVNRLKHLAVPRVTFDDTFASPEPTRRCTRRTTYASSRKYKMKTIPTDTVIAAALLIALVIAVVAWLVMQRKRSARLKERFGPEYDRAVIDFGGRTRAEAELQKREQRVAQLKIVSLTPADAARFSQAWSALQSRFIDNPKGAVVEADQLVRELMEKRGYPMGDFERRAADISVDYPGVVANYRAAQAIATRDASGEADTEELRKAIVHYRTLFDELLEAKPPVVSTVSADHRVPVHS